MLNVGYLQGRLTAKPELNTTNNGKSVVTFTLAVSRLGKNAGTDFIRCTAWQEVAERVCKYVDKGQEIIVEYRLGTRAVTNENTKKTYHNLEVTVNSFSFCGNKPKSQNADEEPVVPETDEDLEPYA